MRPPLAAPAAAPPDVTRFDGALYHRVVEDGYQIVVYPMTFGKARLCYCAPGEYADIIDAFCYATHARAIEAAEAWTGDGDPLDGWHRNPLTGRRRTDGDPATEHVRY